ncbi:MAG: hypothetical protein CMI54_07280 [Parcubacteria group bacterium]|jgi:hypothetical protein|nr:hypothetical protein [Parcubacteria group bacterium]|tara:strand:+ start:3200 stop:4093 length:894 start_codon:yes stop_codon:yes gene_type:complete
MIGIEKKDFDRIINFARASVKELNGAEIGGMAIIQEDEDGDWVISHPQILKQTVDSSSCTIDKESLANYYTKTMMKHGTNIKFVWWHSHGKGSVFWSPTDETAIKEYKGGNWSCSLVVNADADYRLRVDWWKPMPAKLDKLDLTVIGETEHKIPNSITKQVKKLCDTVTHIVPTPNKNGRQMSIYNKYQNHAGYGGYGNYTDGYSYGTYQNYKFGDDYWTYWQKEALQDAQNELEMYADGKLSYEDLQGQCEKTNNELTTEGKLTLPDEKALHKLVDSKLNISIMKYFVKKTLQEVS